MSLYHDRFLVGFGKQQILFYGFGCKSLLQDLQEDLELTISEEKKKELISFKILLNLIHYFKKNKTGATLI